MLRRLLIVATTAAMLAVAAASQSHAAPRVLGKDPANGHGVFRFPQAVAFSPGGAAVFVGDQHSSVVQKFGRDGTWQLDIGWRADGRQRGRIGVIGGLATDRANHLYVLDSENDRVQVFDHRSGEWLGSWGSAGTAPGQFDLGANTGSGGIAVFHPPGAITPVAYIADQYNHRIQRFVLDPTGLPPGARSGGGRVVERPAADRTWGHFGDCASTGSCGDPIHHQSLQYPQGIAVQAVGDQPEGHVVFVADDRNHRVLRTTSSGELLNQVGGVQGDAPGQFQFPYDVGVDGQNPAVLYVADNINHRVQRFDAASLRFQTLWGGYGEISFTRALAALADDPAGGVVATDTAGNRVRGYDPHGNLVVEWGVSGRGPGYSTRPQGVATGDDGTVLIADTLDHRIQVLGADGAHVGQLGAIGAGSGFAQPSAREGAFDSPEGIAQDPLTGHLWVADTANGRVQQLDADGRHLVSHPGFDRPVSIATGPDGAVYVVDTDRVQRRDPASGAWSTIDSTPGVQAVAAAGGDVYVGGRGFLTRHTGGERAGMPAPPGGFGRISGIAVDETRLYLSDNFHDRLWRYEGGAFTQLAGEGPRTGEVLDPNAIAVTPDGATVYVADAGNNRIQAFDGVAHPVRTSATLRVRKDGAGAGVVAAEGGAIDCGARCDATVGRGQLVRLTATPAAGSRFDGWSGACAGTGVCQVRPRTTAEVVARFSRVPRPRDRTAPRVTRVRLTTLGGIRFRLSERARVRITVRRTTRSRTLTKRPITLRGRRGENGRRLPRRARRGRLVVTLIAYDAAGNRSRAVRVRRVR